jgi:hypothetical protein
MIKETVNSSLGGIVRISHSPDHSSFIIEIGEYAKDQEEIPLFVCLKIYTIPKNIVTLLEGISF